MIAEACAQLVQPADRGLPARQRGQQVRHVRQVEAGHPTVFVGKQKLPFARVGDPMKIKQGSIVDGDTTVLLGAEPASSKAGP